MNPVVDANIIFSSLIKEGKTIECLLNLSLKLYSPEFVLDEIEKHKQEILGKTKRSPKELEEIFIMLKQVITIIPKEEFQEQLIKARKISPDPDDIQYFALALKLNCSIWSNDKELKKQDTIRVYSTEEIIEILSL